MLMLMKSQTEAMRALAYVVAAAMDFAHKTDKRHQAFVDLMIPVVKGWCTETGSRSPSLGVQVHGGMGFVEETGAAQYLRDARITTIYEGTTGIQAMDLVGRKIAREGGATAKAWLAELKKLDAKSPPHPEIRKALADGVKAVESASTIVAAKDPRVQFAGAVPLMGIVAGGWQMACGAGSRHTCGDQEFLKAKKATARADHPRPGAGTRPAQYSRQWRRRRSRPPEDHPGCVSFRSRRPTGEVMHHEFVDLQPPVPRRDHGNATDPLAVRSRLHRSRGHRGRMRRWPRHPGGRVTPERRAGAAVNSVFMPVPQHIACLRRHHSS